MVSINTNLSSLMVQNNLTKSTNALNAAIERMTTGYKINGAKDNAANYSIVRDMSAKISGYQVAEENANMGMNMIQTATENLDLISNHLQRVRDLAMQASNGTYGTESLSAIQAEVDARMAEINRIISNTEYNGIQLLEGEQAESNVTGYFLKPVEQLSEEEAIAQGYTVIKTKDDLENIKNDMSGKYILMNDIDLEDSNLSYSYGVPSNCPVFEGELNGNGYVIKNLTISGYYAGLFAKTDGAVIKNLGVENLTSNGSASGGGIAGDAVNSTLTNVYVTGTIEGVDTDPGILCSSSANPNNILSDSYSDVTCRYNYTNHCQAICATPNDVSCTNVYWNSEKCTYPCRAQVSLDGATGLTTAELQALVMDPSEHGGTSAKNITLQVGINSDSSSQISFEMGLDYNLSVDVSSQSSAVSALAAIDTQLQKVSAKQTELGAVQNRLDSVLDSVKVSYDNLVSSRSTLQDADIAKESSEYIKAQILQQASATLLATANQSPSIALQLI